MSKSSSLKGTNFPNFIARSSSIVQSQYAQLASYALRSGDYSELIPVLWQKPIANFLLKMSVEDLRQNINCLARRKLISSADIPIVTNYLLAVREDPFYDLMAAPGAARSHHLYPGGLVIHTLANLKMAETLGKLFGPNKMEPIYGAQIIHDLLKAWLLKWLAPGQISPEIKIGPTNAHHILVLAELLSRDAPPDLIWCSAAVHVDPLAEPHKLGQYIQTAAVLAGRTFEDRFSEMDFVALVISRLAETSIWDFTVRRIKVIKSYLSEVRAGRDWFFEYCLSIYGEEYLLALIKNEPGKLGSWLAKARRSYALAEQRFVREN